MPVSTIKRTGFSLNFLSASRETVNTKTAVKSMESGMERTEEPVKVNSKIVAPAETINPRDADFKPFKTWKT